jgi:alpha-L-arabinofuranosidase
MLYRLHTGDTVLDTAAKSPPVEFNANLPMLDAIATLSGDGKTLYVSVVNRAESHDASASIGIKGWSPKTGTAARALELNGKDKVAANPFGSSDNVNIREKPVTVSGTSLSYKFPAHSVTVIEFSGSR